jgi:class 3 adenylate cyclase/CheY-like chemotaxis protein
MPNSVLSRPNQQTVAKAEAYRRRKRTAVLAIMFTDVEKSTQLREELGEVTFQRIQEQHDSTLRRIVEESGLGAVVSSMGDGVLAVFAEPSTAVERAMEIQSVFRKHDYLRIRIGIDMGQISQEIQGGIVANVFGRHVNRAARIQSLASPAHILTAFHVYDSAVGWLRSTSIEWRNHGLVRLKGFREPIPLVEPFDPTSTEPQFGIRASDLDALRQASLHNEAQEQSRPRVRTRGSKLSIGATRAHHDTNLRTEMFEYSVALTGGFSSSDPLAYCQDALRELLEQKRASESASEPLSANAFEVLWVSDPIEDDVVLRQHLQRAGCAVRVVTSLAEARKSLSKARYDVVISAMRLAGAPTAGLELLALQRQAEIRFPTIIHTSAGLAATYAEEARRLGALTCTSGAVSVLHKIHTLVRGCPIRC